MSPSLKQCYEMLNRTSRLYCIGFQMFEREVRVVIYIFYLVLRGLDTVEDDQSIPKDTRIKMLKSFYKNLENPNWKFCESKDKDKIVLENFPAITKEYQKLKKVYRDIISCACRDMGAGTAIFQTKEIETVTDWDMYCHYVAGVVGVGLLKAAVASGLEDKTLETMTDLADLGGIAIQKGFHINDFFDDFSENKTFWPKSIWSKYVRDMRDITKPENREKALHCLNEVITNVLELLPSVTTVLSHIRNPGIIIFSAAIQLTNVALLERCYNNPGVFKSAVKIRKGEVARFFISATTFDKTMNIMRELIQKLHNRIPDTDPSAAQTRAMCLKALDAMGAPQQQPPTVWGSSLLYIILVLSGAGIAFMGYQTFRLSEVLF